MSAPYPDPTPVYTAPTPAYMGSGPTVVVMQQPVNVGGEAAPRGPPVGVWADGMCDCCKECGSLWMACCCACFPLAQLAQKSQCCGQNPYCTILFSVILLVLIANGAAAIGLPNVQGFIIFFFIFFIRQKVMEKYQIPYSCCENCWCSLCCGCCMIAQMMRHVFGYKTGCQGCVFDKEPADLWQV